MVFKYNSCTLENIFVILKHYNKYFTIADKLEFQMKEYLKTMFYCLPQFVKLKKPHCCTM